MPERLLVKKAVASVLFLELAATACGHHKHRSLPSENASFAPRAKTANCHIENKLADRLCTPGAVFAGITVAKLCVKGYASSVRDVPEFEKKAVYKEYGITTHRPYQYEVDHLVSLELGGSNSIANLWPEAASPTPGYHQKDKVENYLHQQVCAGKIALAKAQQEEVTNWLAIYQQIKNN